MSSSIVVNKAELSRLLTELGELLPDDLAQAEAVLSRRDAMLYEATANAERLLTAAIEERARMVSEEEVLREARIEAAELIRDAHERSQRTSREIDEYVDAKLAHLEVSVTNILETVRQGRQRLAQPGLYSELGELPEAGPGSGIEPAPSAGRSMSPETADSFALGTGTDQSAEWNAPPRWDAQSDRYALPRWGPMADAAVADQGSDLLGDSARPGGNSETAQGAATAEASAGWTPRRPEDFGEFNRGDLAASEQPAAEGPAADLDEPATAHERAAEGEPASGEPQVTAAESAATAAEAAATEGEPASAAEPPVAETGAAEGEPATEGESAAEGEPPGEEVATDQPSGDAEDQPEEQDETAAEPRPQEARAE
ncbi:MAG TPA: hypothetical protein VK895_02115 [Jiangellaceae bacterium]|nr:hypothetical protein [Jiangellaceae bacterium]